jgi:hypothetical protein
MAVDGNLFLPSESLAVGGEAEAVKEVLAAD